MTFSAITLFYLRIHSSKNYSPIFLPVFTLISSISLLWNTTRMLNQFIRTTHLFLNFILTTQPIFLKHFYIFIFLILFCTTPKKLPQLMGTRHTNGRRPRTTDDPEGGPKVSKLPQTRRSWQAAPAFPGAQTTSTPRTTEPLPPVK